MNGPLTKGFFLSEDAVLTEPLSSHVVPHTSLFQLFFPSLPLLFSPPPSLLESVFYSRFSMMDINHRFIFIIQRSQTVEESGYIYTNEGMRISITMGCTTSLYKNNTGGFIIYKPLPQYLVEKILDIVF